MAAGTLLGVGMGGFLDGIMLHQILQVHHMVSAKYPKVGVDSQSALVNTEINMFWDGLFHAFTWIMTAAGLALLWNVARRRDVLLSTPVLIGSMVMGWGLFNLIEGVVDHHILNIHHVIERPGHLVWDLAFLASGVVMIVVGIVVIRSDRRQDVRPVT